MIAEAGIQLVSHHFFCVILMTLFPDSFVIVGVAEAQSPKCLEGRWFKSGLLLAACQSVLVHDPEPRLAPGVQMDTLHGSIHTSVHEWVNVARVAKHFERSVDWQSATEMQVH